MRTYFPDRWVIVDTGICIKVFATFFGSFTSGDAWKLSSGTIEIKEDTENWILPQYSGSEYILRKGKEGTSGYSNGVLSGFLEDDRIRVITIGKSIQLLEEGNR